MKYKFNKELKEAILVKRNSQFTMNIEIDGKIEKTHCPTINRIGDIETKNIACLVSVSDDPKRKLKYTVEAVSCDELDKKDKNWIGINQILSNKLVEFFLETHQLDNMVSNYDSIKREVNLGISKLDFLVGNTYLEVKTPLTTLNVKYGSNIKIKEVTPFSSTDRFTKHINELAGKAPDKKHPYGYGRIEYMTSLIVSAIVLYAGITALVESVKKIVHPEVADYSTITLIILIAGIIVKFVLGIYVKKKGKDVNSDSLVASGSDAFNDAILSISVLASAIIYMIFQISLEAYVGVILSIFIIKAGFELIKESVDNMLGVRIESELARSIKKEITKEKDVQGAYDLILNDYGPDKYLGSIHIEVNDTLSVADVDKISRRITKTILEKYGVILHTIGVYSVNTKDKKVIETKKEITKIVFAHKEVLQMHGFYLDDKEKTISFDIIIDFKVKNREEVYKEIYDKVQEKYKDYKLDVTLDVDVSD